MLMFRLCAADNASEELGKLHVSSPESASPLHPAPASKDIGEALQNESNGCAVPKLTTPGVESLQCSIFILHQSW